MDIRSRLFLEKSYDYAAVSVFWELKVKIQSTVYNLQSTIFPKMNLNKINLSKLFFFGSSAFLAVFIASIVKGFLGSHVTSLARGVGAYYYPWYSLVRWEKDKKVMGKPLLGPYESDDVKVIKQHIDWAKGAGIDYFIYSWLGSDKDEHKSERYYSNRLKAVASSNSFFLIPLYETPLALFQSPDFIDFDASYSDTMTVGKQFVKDMIFYAEQGAVSKSSFKHDNCPKILLYLVRNFVNHEKYFDVLRDALTAKSLCLEMAADVVFWNSVDRPLRHGRRGNQHQWEWISRNFSEIFGYNYYTDNRSLYEDANNFSSQYLSAKRKAQRQWAARASEFNLTYVYSVQPGYDDRPLRGSARPYISASSVFYSRDWERVIAAKSAGCSVAITSFNEWYEDTQIEPTSGKAKSPISKDDSKSGNFFTEGNLYYDYGPLYLDILRSKFGQ